MDYALIPSLKSIALVETVILVWSQDDSRDLIAKLFFPRLSYGYGLYNWKRIENKVLNQISKLLLPVLLKRKAMDFYEWIGVQIVKWIKCHEALFSDQRAVRESLNRLRWTSRGLVDKKKTAKMLIKDDILNINARYVLACVYCLEDDIPKLWNRIPENDRALFADRGNPMNIQQWDLVVVWTHDLKGEIADLNLWGRYEYEFNWNIRHTAYQYAFEYAAKGGNRAAAEYFLQKVTPELRRDSMLKTAKCITEIEGVGDPITDDDLYPLTYWHHRSKQCFADVLLFLLSQINGMETSIGAKELVCFLDWPFLNTFLEIVSRMWCFLSQYDFIVLVTEITDQLIHSDMDRKFRKLLREFWEQSPLTHRRGLLNEEPGRHTLLKLVLRDEDTFIKLIFKDLTEGRKNFICSRDGVNICSYLIYYEKWDLIYFFIRECLPSTDEIINFQEAYKDDVSKLFSAEKWTRFCQLLNNIVCEYDKRNRDKRKRRFCSENENRLI